MKYSNYRPMMKMLAFSVAFTFMILVIRICVTRQPDYGNYFWNTFLAAIPLLFSFLLIRKQRGIIISSLYFFLWLIFLPNAPYLITDLVHFDIVKGFPGWVDIILVTSASWNGLLLGFISMIMMEEFLRTKIKPLSVQFVMFGCMVLTGYGIYLGRFLRYNSWDIVADPVDLLSDSLQTIIYPGEHLRTWGFTLLFSVMYTIFYFTIKQITLVRNQP